MRDSSGETGDFGSRCMLIEYKSGEAFTAWEVIRESIGDALDFLAESVNSVDGNIEVFSSVAEGADILACEVCMEKEVLLHIILPKSLLLQRGL